MTTNDPFAFLDFSQQEAQEADEQLKKPRSNRDSRICACGHPMGRHTNLSGMTYCKPTRMECPCKHPKPVLEASDVRPFLRKTNGAGPMHALGRGLAAAAAKDVEVRWLIEMRCDRCKAEGPVSPVPVTQRGIAVTEATGFDAFLCADCRTAI